MRTRIVALIGVAGVLAATAGSGGVARSSIREVGAPPARLPRSLPLSFEPNVGQAPSQVRFQSRSLGGTTYFTRRGLVLALPGPGVVRVGFEGANSAPQLVPERRLRGVVNYLRGKDPTSWRTNIPTYAAVVYHELYDGIDLRYAGSGDRLKSTYTIRPGDADAASIRWRYFGAERVRVERVTGNLVVTLAAAELVERAPVAWQELDGRRISVSAGYRINSDGSVGFALGRYDRRRGLVIDPTLTYSSYLGGSGGEQGFDIALDAGGNVYVTGTTNSNDFPLANALQPARKGYSDVFVTKLSPDGRRLLYSTYVGGSEEDVGLGIAIDATGNAYVTGESWSNDFPVVNPFQQYDPGIQQDVIVFKLNASGSALLYSTYLGGVNSQTGWDIAVDSAGSAYVTGHTLSGGTFPVVNAYQPKAASAREGFVSKLSADGSRLVYSTYLGGSNDEWGQGIAVDSAGAAYVVGFTASSDFPIRNALQSRNAGFDDVYVVKLDPQGAAVYSTYLGGADNDQGTGIAVDAAGNVYLTGDTTSTDFPVAGAIQAASKGYSDAFVTKVNAIGSALAYSTYLGGGVNDYGREVALDSAGNAYVAGWTSSTDFPIVSANAIQPCPGGDDQDAFVAKVNGQGSALGYSIYLGGWVQQAGIGDYAYGIAVDGPGNAWVTGYTYTSDFPLAGTPLRTTNAGFSDAFVARVGVELTADFSLCRKPSVQIIRPGATARYTIDLSSGNGFAGSVNVSVSGLPSNLTASFSSNPVTLTAGATATTVLSIKTKGNEPDGTYTLRITATGGGRTHARDVKFTVVK